jgi:hypothetical protein
MSPGFRLKLKELKLQDYVRILTVKLPFARMAKLADALGLLGVIMKTTEKIVFD